MLGFINGVLSGLGPFAVIPQDLFEEATGTFSALAEDPEAFAASVMDATPAPKGNAGDQVDNIFYINLNQTADGPEWEARLKAVKKNVDLSNMFCDWKADQAVQAKLDSKQLVDDPKTRATYKAKVVNTLTNTCPWIANFGAQVITKKFQVEKKVFHDTLVSTFTQGLGLPTSINSKFEDLLTNMKNTIDKSTTDVDRNKTDVVFFVLLTTYVKDDLLQTYRPQMRTIYFKVNQSLSNFAKTKNSTETDVNVEMEYAQTDGSFNTDYFASNAAPTVSSLVNQASNAFLGSTIDVAV